MKLRARLLRSLAGGCGPASKNVLRGMALYHGYTREEFKETFAAMLADGEIVMIGDRRGATYAIPKGSK